MDPLHISGTDKARGFKFGVRIERQACNPKNVKLGQKGRGRRHVTYFYNFGKAIDFKFGVRIDRQAYKPENAKVGQKGRDLLHMTLLL